MGIKWDLWDFPDYIYVLIEDKARKDVFSKMHKKIGSGRKYAKFLGLSQTQIRNYFNGKTLVNGKYHIQYTPLWVLKKSVSLVDAKTKRKIENNIIAIRSRAGLSVYRPKLPIEELPALYSVLFHIICDGSAGKGKTPYYANTCRELRNKFIEHLKIFGSLKTKTYLMHDKVYAVMFPKAITDILMHIFNVKFTRTPKLPERIFKAPLNCKAAALRAMFDDEGTVVRVSRQVSLVSAKIGIVTDTKKLLLQCGISCHNIYTTKRSDGKIDYRIAIAADSRKRFLDIIGFDSPSKMYKLEKLVKEVKTRKKRKPNSIN